MTNMTTIQPLSRVNLYGGAREVCLQLCAGSVWSKVEAHQIQMRYKHP